MPFWPSWPSWIETRIQNPDLSVSATVPERVDSLTGLFFLVYLVRKSYVWITSDLQYDVSPPQPLGTLRICMFLGILNPDP
jgi:hypothetical protein